MGGPRANSGTGVGNPALIDSGVWHGRQKEPDTLVAVTWHGTIYGHHTAYL